MRKNVKQRIRTDSVKRGKAEDTEAGMEKWTQGWLVYRPVKEAGNAQLAGSMKLTGFDREHPIEIGRAHV